MDALMGLRPWLLSVGSASLASWLTYRLTSRAARETEMRTLRLGSAEELARPLRDLQGLLRRHGHIEPSPTPGEIAAAIVEWTTAFDRVGHRLPDAWQHIGRSVRAATGEAFGAVTFANILPETATESLAGPHFRWQDYADEYIDNLLAAVLRWCDPTDGDDRGKRPLIQYDPWLRQTGRTDPPGSTHMFQDPWWLRRIELRSA
ncbi:hypothetical protein [Nocardioides rubriscoriae]|uniref:hypothetical protein n=1 Tax=Nocardioides rubriscoriae TaxID=642762 RepID=UPI0011DF4389|nr:hypothetical protein [Nocardioides rubriscoriae]